MRETNRLTVKYKVILHKPNHQLALIQIYYKLFKQVLEVHNRQHNQHKTLRACRQWLIVLIIQPRQLTSKLVLVYCQKLQLQLMAIRLLLPVEIHHSHGSNLVKFKAHSRKMLIIFLQLSERQSLSRKQISNVFWFNRHHTQQLRNTLKISAL